MKLTTKDLEHLEALSRITLPASQEETYLEKLSEVLIYLEQLEKVETSGVIPTSQVTELKSGLREDEVRPGLPQEDVLKNSKHTLNGYFKVPRVIE